MSSYFFRDEFNGDFETFDTIEEAFKYANVAIRDLDGEGGWLQEVLDGAFQIGVIAYMSSEANRREHDIDDDGEAVNHEFDYICDIKMVENINPITNEIEILKEEIQKRDELLEQVYKKLRGTIEWNGNDFSKWLKQYEELNNES